jgi:GMP synthase-like glutamine amidotransferase
MKPVLVLQHLGADGPAFLGTWLQQRGVPADVRNAEAGDAFPATMDGHSALAVLGGEMSANDPLPTLRQAEALILQAMASGRPVLGHCLGGQLMARALGARVLPSPAPEVGWQSLWVEDCAEGREWFGGPGEHTVFHWHFEAFEMPAGAVKLASSVACPHQAFAVGPHLAMQFHVELDADKLARWSMDEGGRYRAALLQHPSVQSGAAMREGAARHLARQQALAACIYQRWWNGAMPAS